MESALYGIFTLVGFVSEISLVRCAYSFDFRYFLNSCENPIRTRFPWCNLYLKPATVSVTKKVEIVCKLAAKPDSTSTTKKAEVFLKLRTKHNLICII